MTKVSERVRQSGSWTLSGPELVSLLDASVETFVLVDADGRIVDFNRSAETMFGWRRDEALGAALTDLVLAEDLSAADRAGMARFLAGDGVRSAGTRTRLRMRHRDGHQVPVEATVSPIEGGERPRLAVLLHDISGSDRATERLSELHSRFAGAFEAAPTGMALVATDGRFLEVNAALCELLDRDAETLRATTFQELTHPEDLDSDLEQLERTLSGEIDSYQMAKRYLLPGGGIVWGLLTVTLVRDADGRPLQFVSQIQDITDRKTAEGELRRYADQLAAISEQDPLTGLRNRRTFETALDEELRVLGAGGAPCSILLAAVDGDDSAIAVASAALDEVSRTDDLVAYLGGGELAVLLCGVDNRAAQPIVRRAAGALGEGVRCAHATARRGETPSALLARARAKTGPAPERAPHADATPAPANIGRLLELARRQLGMPVSFLTRHEGTDSVFARFAGQYEQFGLSEGDSMPLAAMHCQRMLDGRIGSIVTDLAAEAETRDLEVTTAFGLRTYAGVPVRLRSGELYGTLCAVDTEPHPELNERHTELLHFISELAAELIEEEAEREAARRTEAGATGVRTLLAALEARDFYTGEHSKQVVALASAVAKRLGLDEDAVRDVEQVALLHDVGKVGIPDAILQKQGPLDQQEWELMRQHPVVGERIIAGTAGLTHLAPAMRAEHERWDGRGYPDGLAGEDIPLASRITLACDALNAMTSDRPYRPALTLQCACRELRACAGTQFDPRVVGALLAELEQGSAAAPDDAG